MSLRSKLGVCAAFIGALAFATPVFAQHAGSHGHGTHAGAPRGGAPHGGTFRGGSRSMPQRGFRGTPPGFHGNYPRAGGTHGRFHGTWQGTRGGGLGTFHGRHYRDFGRGDRYAWQRGRWRHDWHDGRLAWWWFVDGLWFYYPAPIYPYPSYVGPGYYDDYYDEYGTPPYYWYYCDDPPGYYPYVRRCNGRWQPVPPTPGP